MDKVKLSDVCEIMMGQSPPGSSYSEQGEGVPLLNGAADIKIDGLAPRKWTTAPTRTCKKGDAVICIRATIGRTTAADGEYCLGRGVAALRPYSTIDLNYLIYVVENNLQQLNRFLSGSTIKGIRREHLELIEFNLPSLDEQRKIAAILGKVDDIIKGLKDEKSLRGGLIETILNTTITSALPRKKLASLVDSSAPIRYGIVQPGPVLESGIKYVRPMEISDDGKIDLDSIRHTSTEIAHKYRNATLHSGDVLITIVGTLGRIAIVPPELEGANITQSSARIRPDNSQISTDYTYWVLKSFELKKQYDKKRLGTGVPRLNIAHVRGLEIPYLNPIDQKRLVDVLGNIQSGVFDTDNVLSHSNELQDALIQEMITCRA